MDIERKVAVITGASQGIGAALVKAYRDRNYRVVATRARSSRRTTRTSLRFPATSPTERRPSARSREGMARFGRIDTLVNNAGIFIAKPFTQYTEADYAAILGVNVTGFFHITQLAIAEMEKQGSGHVVQITTSLVDNAIVRRTVRARVADKGRPECRDQIARDRVCEARYPGERGRAGRHQVADAPVETYPQLDPLHPIGHMGEISDVVDAILYLESASFVTGEILHVDGGQSAGH